MRGGGLLRLNDNDIIRKTRNYERHTYTIKDIQFENAGFPYCIHQQYTYPDNITEVYTKTQNGY